MTPGEGEEAFPSYRPSVFYFRQALRESDDPEELREIGLLLCAAYEDLRAWVRSRGQIPPKNIILEAEAQAKGWDTDPFVVDDPNQIFLPLDPAVISFFSP